MRRSLWLLPVLLVLGLAGVPASTAAGCAQLRRAGRWTTFDRPVFSPGDYAAQATGEGGAMAGTWPGGRPGRFFASNGARLWRTTDYGCTWRVVFSLRPADRTDTGTPAPSLGNTVFLTFSVPYAIAGTAIAASGKAATADVVWAFITGGANPLAIARSTDGGSTWTTHFVTAPRAPGTPPVPVVASLPPLSALAVSGADQQTAYLAVAMPDRPDVAQASITTSTLLVTHDGGASWAIVADLGYGSYDLAPDPLAPQRVCLAARQSGLKTVRCFDGTTARTVLTLPNTWYINGLDTAYTAAGRVETAVTAQMSDNDHGRYYGVWVTTDGGKHWSTATRKTFDVWTSPIGRARVAANGDVYLARSATGVPNADGYLDRWSLAKRAFAELIVIGPPVPPGNTKFANLTEFTDNVFTGDPAHRTFLFWGRAANTTSDWPYLVATYDTGPR